MAKGNMLQGQATGKVGDIVFMVRNGQQVARVYTSAGGRSGDQASIAVRRQRVRFGAASNQYLLYRNIVRGMYRTGKNTKQSDYNFFVRENVDLLPYLTREENAAGVKCAMPGTFSRGTLGQLIYSLVESQSSGTPVSLEVVMPNFSVDSPITYAASVADFKDALKANYPNARKVTFALCYIYKSELDLPSGTAYSHTFERGDVVFDLYEADENVADTADCAAYFAYYAPTPLKTIFAGMTDDTLCETGKALVVTDPTGDLPEALSLCYVNIFATNDQVGDCYTSTLTEITAPDSDGGLSLYSTLRTDDHRQVAEDSYGYATGVMRTNIQQA